MILNRPMCLAFCCLVLCGCWGEKQTQYGPASEVNDYLDEMKDILQELRLLDHRIGQVVSSDTVASHMIVPLIASDFQPTIAGLRQRALDLDHPSGLDPIHQQLLDYLTKRLEAYDLALEGERQNRSELFDQFPERQAEAEVIGRDLQDAIKRVRANLGLR